ncbi:hypothetical protein N7492_009944 [Penicillium capsulatum]|uniref:Protein kinase domain-containing protein n=1 Tax=Penicillium capsulatum TaxID=69766 RepID=A0A9W9HQ68_9EURO|nr:hypothetical protein N7492_009944 [Penicillium capsulatum]KAJ6112455.1 hypothetical protein N7512_007779 [Penicillium capsulatum]
MDIQHQFPDVHWIWGGGISFVYEVHPRIVVKVPKSGDFNGEQFKNEVDIYQIFSQHRPCPSIVQCFLSSDKGIFLEYMREWMNDLAQAVAFLESLGLAHGDLRPENILLDRDRLKLSDFDCIAKIGTIYETCMAPYGRLLNSNESDQGDRGTAGLLSPRTEQFAIGSIFYFINYGFEVYSDHYLTNDPYDHGPKVVELLQDMEFPKLHSDNASVDNIIDRCWHHKYSTIAELATHTRMLLDGPQKADGSTSDNQNQARLDDEYLSHQEFCKNLERRGLLQVLTSGEPEQLGFPLKWYRHSAPG